MISVLMPTYNRADFIRESIDSVINQSYEDFEFVIVDDGSTDHTPDIIQSYSDLRIKYHIIKHSGMVSHVRNVTLEKARGDYLAFLDSDDLWEPDHLENLLKAMNTHEETGIAFSNVIEFEEGRILRNGIYSDKKAIMPKGAVDLLPMILHRKFSIYPTSLLLRSDAVKKAGKFRDSLSITETHLIARVAKNVKAVYVPKVTAKVRKHGDNHSEAAPTTAFTELFMLIDELKASGDLSSKEHRQLSFKYHYRFGIERTRHQDLKSARSAFSKALILRPWSVKSVYRWASTWVYTQKN